MSAGQTSFEFGGVKFLIHYSYEAAESPTFDSPGCDEEFGIDRIIFPDGNECGTEHFNESTLAWIEKEVRKQLEGEARSALEDRAVERHFDNQWSHGRRYA